MVSQGDNSESWHDDDRPIFLNTGRGIGRKVARRWSLWLIGLAVLVAFILISQSSDFLVQWLWMGQLGFSSVFWRTFFLKSAMFGFGFLAVLLFVWLNLQLAARRILSFSEENSAFFTIAPRRILERLYKPLIAAASVFLALFFGSGFIPFWERLLLFIWGGSFDAAEPVYNLDIGFYVFRLPLLHFLQSVLSWLSLIVLVLLVMGYSSARLLPGRFGQVSQRSWGAVRHISLILLVFVASLGWKFYLDRFDLLFSSGGVVFGAGYTDLNVLRIGLWIMVAVSVLLALVVLYTFVVHRINLIILGSVLYGAVGVVVIILLPYLVQNFKVQPNELELESPYLERNIAFTRQSYQLDRIEERDYPDLKTLTMKDLAQNRETVDNIRLWDWRPIRQTFRQTQEIRTYYKFYEVDVDRYNLPGGDYRQVMLSARELAPQLPEQARTWVNERLQFTHGYGLAMSPVSEFTGEGLPDYLIKDLPPVSGEGLEVNRPAIYFGESMSGYRIVNTDVEEFDYPSGDENVYSRYQGKGGIPLSGLLKRILFAWDLSDINILMTSSLREGSRVQIHREVADRIRTVAPFLYLDDDPYLVLADGGLYWIQDAYTVSSRYPYSEPFFGNLNYIRNSVKVVVDAYDGSVRFYVADAEEPILNAYRNAFPGLFTDIGEMSRALRAHLRYPEDLFRVQVEKFNDYHMTIPQVFYNREDKWTFPTEKYAGDQIPMEPYYILIALPGEPSIEFLIMTPLTPDNRDNMIAWLAARCDQQGYGEIIAYKLPKERLIYGPIQIEAMIDQDDVISRQLSLWDQRGSRVIRGNLLVIPVEQSFIYVEPVYLLAEGNDIPQLRRVILVYNQRVVMERTLQEAVEVVFGEVAPTRPEPIEVRQPPAPTAPPAEPGGPRDTLRKAQEALQQGDWEEFGRAMQELQRQLERSPESRVESPER